MTFKNPLDFRSFTAEEDNVLINSWGKVCAKQLSYILARTEKSIYNRAVKLGLKKFDRQEWGEEETGLFKEMQQRGETKETIAGRLNRPIPSIQSKARRLGLKLCR